MNWPTRKHFAKPRFLRAPTRLAKSRGKISAIFSVYYFLPSMSDSYSSFLCGMDPLYVRVCEQLGHEWAAREAEKKNTENLQKKSFVLHVPCELIQQFGVWHEENTTSGKSYACSMGSCWWACQKQLWGRSFVFHRGGFFY